MENKTKIRQVRKTNNGRNSQVVTHNCIAPLAFDGVGAGAPAVPSRNGGRRGRRWELPARDNKFPQQLIPGQSPSDNTPVKMRDLVAEFKYIPPDGVDTDLAFDLLLQYSQHTGYTVNVIRASFIRFYLNYGTVFPVDGRSIILAYSRRGNPLRGGVITRHADLLVSVGLAGFKDMRAFMQNFALDARLMIRNDARLTTNGFLKYMHDNPRAKVDWKRELSFDFALGCKNLGRNQVDYINLVSKVSPGLRCDIEKVVRRKKIVSGGVRHNKVPVTPAPSFEIPDFELPEHHDDHISRYDEDLLDDDVDPNVVDDDYVVESEYCGPYISLDGLFASMDPKATREYEVRIIGAVAADLHALEDYEDRLSDQIGEDVADPELMAELVHVKMRVLVARNHIAAAYGGPTPQQVREMPDGQLYAAPELNPDFNV